MKTPKPLSAERLNELCARAKMSENGTVIIWCHELLALVDMTKERNELLEDKNHERQHSLRD